MDMNEATAKAISAERAAAGLTIKELSEKADIPERTLMRILKAERDIKINQISQLAEALELYPHEIVSEAEKYISREERASVMFRESKGADYSDSFNLVAKRGDIEREQEMYNDLP